MKIKSGPIQTVLAAIVAIAVTVGLMFAFGVFVGHDSIKEAVQASKGTVLFAMAIGVASYLATIWLTSLNQKELEALEVRTSISGDVAKTIACLRNIQKLSKDNSLEAKIQSTTNFVVNAITVSTKALVTKLQPEEMSVATKLCELSLGYENALFAFISNKKQASYDQEAAANAENFRQKSPLMLIGFVNLMREIQSNDGSLSTATDEIMAKLGAWGYVGQLDKLNMEKGKEK